VNRKKLSIYCDVSCQRKGERRLLKIKNGKFKTLRKNDVFCAWLTSLGVSPPFVTFLLLAGDLVDLLMLSASGDADVLNHSPC